MNWAGIAQISVFFEMLLFLIILNFANKFI